VGAQPSVEDPDHSNETAGVAHYEEGLTAADSAGASEGIRAPRGRLCLGEREPEPRRI